MTASETSSGRDEIDGAIGSALRDLRENLGLTARQLAAQSGISAAMISRIETGQTSPSISTLNALSGALGVPIVSLFRETASVHVDYTYVEANKGLKSTRIVGGHSHEFTNLAFHPRRDLQFEARMVTLIRQDASPPTYVGHGVVFIYAISGEAVYSYGQREIVMKEGDSLSIDAELRYGFKRVITPEFTFLTVQAERRK
ncbi:MAG: XRE family transcriptional regulator [Pseudomonadota bacterium]